MARESKQERVIRGILDQLTEHLHELKGLEENPSTKEMDVERWCQSVLRNVLGFTATAGYSIRAQESKSKMRPDLIVFNGEKPIFVVEVKKLNFDLNKSELRSGKVQLREYLHNLGDVRWGILSNGFEWKLFDFSSAGAGIEIAAIDVRGNNEILETSRKAVEELAWDLVDLHEWSFAGKVWGELSKEATAFSPESLARAVLSADVVKYIAKSIRGEHEYKANMEILTDKIYFLLEQGLNDAIAGWNDNMAAEFSKYIKAQKRASRSSKRATKRSRGQFQESPAMQVDVAKDEKVDSESDIQQNGKVA
jgi:hypothetical protein